MRTLARKPLALKRTLADQVRDAMRSIAEDEAFPAIDREAFADVANYASAAALLKLRGLLR